MTQNLLSIVSVLIAFIGIPILYIQLRGLKVSIRNSTHAAIYGQAETLRGYLIQYPHLRKYFFDNEEILPDDKNYSRVVSIAEIYLNYLEQIAVLKDSFGKENLNSLRKFTKSALKKSPIVRQHLKSDAALYSNALHRMAEEKQVGKNKTLFAIFSNSQRI